MISKGSIFLISFEQFVAEIANQKVGRRKRVREGEHIEFNERIGPSHSFAQSNPRREYEIDER